MRYLFADSTGQFTYTPLSGGSAIASEPTLGTVAIYDETVADANAVTFAGSASWSSGAWTLTLASTEITSADYLYHELIAKWPYTSSGSTRTDYERVVVVRYDNETSWLTTPTRVARMLNHEDDSQYLILADLITEASAAIRDITGHVTVSRETETRRVRLDNTRIYRPTELVSVTSIADKDGTTLTADTDYYVITGQDGFVERIEFIVYHDGLYDIAGVWGYQDVPSALEKACVDAVIGWYNRDAVALSTIYDPNTGLIERHNSLPASSYQLVTRWCDANRRGVL